MQYTRINNVNKCQSSPLPRGSIIYVSTSVHFQRALGDRPPIKNTTADLRSTTTKVSTCGSFVVVIPPKGGTTLVHFESV